MSYRIYKLNFPNGIHIGGLAGIGLEMTSLSMCSDTLYSALYLEYMRLYGKDKADDKENELYKMSLDNDFAISDLFPFKGKDLYIRKPFLNIDINIKNNDKITIDRKKEKKLKYIRADILDEYIKFTKTGEGSFDTDEDFGEKQLYTKNKFGIEDSEKQLYSIEVFKFKQNCGLYFIVKLKDEFVEKFENILESLSYTGIGGKKSSGYGQFDFKKEDRIILNKDKKTGNDSVDFINKSLYSEGKNYMMLSSYAPKDEEVDKIKNEDENSQNMNCNFYSLIRRSGFVNLSSYSKTPQKRKQIYMLSSGSVLNFKPEGKIVDLRAKGNHSVYRMGKPIVMEVNLCQG